MKIVAVDHPSPVSLLNEMCNLEVMRWTIHPSERLWSLRMKLGGLWWLPDGLFLGLFAVLVCFVCLNERGGLERVVGGRETEWDILRV